MIYVRSNTTCAYNGAIGFDGTFIICGHPLYRKGPLGVKQRSAIDETAHRSPNCSFSDSVVVLYGFIYVRILYNLHLYVLFKFCFS